MGTQHRRGFAGGCMLHPPDPKKAKPPMLGGVAGVSGINTLSKDVEGYGTRKLRTNATGRYLLGGCTDKISHRLLRCANHLNWRWYPEQDHRVLSAAKFCQLHLLCPNCAHRRASKQGAKVHEKLNHLADQFDYWFITLTVANGPDLLERYRHLVKSFGKLRNLSRDHLRGKGRYVELSRAKGLVWAYEFTHSEETGWHPHIHMIAALPKGAAPIRWGIHPTTGEISPLRADWHAVTGDSIITHARPVDMADPHKAVCELVKYSLKFSDLSIPDSVEAWDALRGKKLCESSGALRGVDIPESDDLLDDLLTGEYYEFLYKWHGDEYTLVGNTWRTEQNLLESPYSNTGDTDGHSVTAANGIPQGQPCAERVRQVEGAC